LINNSISLVNENPAMVGTKSEYTPLEVQMTNENKQQGT
jgi:hypothetical protein